MEKEQALRLFEEIKQSLGWDTLQMQESYHDASGWIKDTPTERSIHIAAGGYGKEGRISISTVYPKWWDGSTHYGYQDSKSYSITVADTKTAQQIIKDIQRRLLPEYEQTLAAFLKHRAEGLAEHNRRVGALTRLAAAMGLEYEYGKQYAKGNYEFSGYDDGHYRFGIHRVKASYTGAVEVELDIDEPKALLVIAALKAAEQPTTVMGSLLDEATGRPLSEVIMEEAAGQIA